MSEVFICKTAYSPLSLGVSCSAKYAKQHGFVPCGFATESYDDASAHVDANKGGNTGCWVESHADGDTNKPVLREMHGSDYGGVYVNDRRDNG